MPLLLMALLFDHLADQLTTPGCYTGVKNNNEALMMWRSWDEGQRDLLGVEMNRISILIVPGGQLAFLTQSFFGSYLVVFAAGALVLRPGAALCSILTLY